MIPPFSEHRLPRGRHGLPREAVAENQRWRLLGAGAEIFAERGYVATTTRLIARRAAVSSSDFYTHFEGVRDILLACSTLAVDSFLEALQDGCGSQSTWSGDVDGAVENAIAFCSSEPQIASLLGLELSVGVAAVAAERERLIGRLAEPLRARHGVARNLGVPEAAADLLASAVLALMVERVAGEGGDPLPELGSELASAIGLVAL